MLTPPLGSIQYQLVGRTTMERAILLVLDQLRQNGWREERRPIQYTSPEPQKYIVLSILKSKNRCMRAGCLGSGATRMSSSVCRNTSCVYLAAQRFISHVQNSRVDHHTVQPPSDRNVERCQALPVCDVFLRAAASSKRNTFSSPPLLLTRLRAIPATWRPLTHRCPMMCGK